MKKLCPILLTISLLFCSSAFGIDYGDDIFIAVESGGASIPTPTARYLFENDATDEQFSN